MSCLSTRCPSTSTKATTQVSKKTMIQREVEDALSLCMLGMTDLPFFRYDALKPSTDSMMSGGRMKLRETGKK